MAFIAIGGFFGAICRYVLGQMIAKKNTSKFPLGTFLINVSGCFLIGLSMQLHLNEMWFALLTLGFLGAFTTFSTFSFEALQLIRADKLFLASLYMITSCLICLGATAIGYFM